MLNQHYVFSDDVRNVVWVILLWRRLIAKSHTLISLVVYCLNFYFRTLSHVFSSFILQVFLLRHYCLMKIKVVLFSSTFPIAQQKMLSELQIEISLKIKLLLFILRNYIFFPERKYKLQKKANYLAFFQITNKHKIILPSTWNTVCKLQIKKGESSKSRPMIWTPKKP